MQQAGHLHRRRPPPLLGRARLRAPPGRRRPGRLRCHGLRRLDREAIATYEREWGEAPTDSSDPTLQLRLLCARPAGWRDSSVRASLPQELVAFLDGEPADSLKADLRVLRDESAERGWEAAVEGMSRSLAATGGIDRASVALSAARAAAGDERVEYDEEVDLGVYDGALRLLEGGGWHAADELGA